MSDSKYFSTTKKGEVAELAEELNSDKKDRKKDAVKRVIASMTVGKDVSSIFTDVVNCMQTNNIELKKLVYLYIMNYAKSQPELAILAVNSFVKDCEDPSPLVRALAVRTMGCIRVENITEYLCRPLRQCLKDSDPYVRKTAAVCVAKMYDVNRETVVEQGFIEMLRNLLSDSNPMVISNAVAALTEINNASDDDVFQLTPSVLNKLLTALNECTEWGQVFILDCMASYEPVNENEAMSVIERIMPRVAHANAAVVLSAIKVMMKILNCSIEDRQFIEQTKSKLSPPLVTLLSAEPEIQYVALRNINLIVQRYPDVLKKDLKAFFVKYNDPIYVKMEKLDIMIRLCSTSNANSVLMELKEYATEVDIDFVRRSVRAIGRVAILIDDAADNCITTLMELIQTKVSYVVQEAVVVIRDIFRRYPNTYEKIIGPLCENLDSLDEPDAKASMIWILGEYSERIENADELLEYFVETFNDEPSQVQLTLLTSVVKLFLKKQGPSSSTLVQRVLTLATQESDNPDLRDRGFIYWRLLSTDPQTAKEIVLADKPKISRSTDMLDVALLDELMVNMATIASVYHKPASSFVEGRVSGLDRSQTQQRKSKDYDGDAGSPTNEEEANHTAASPAQSTPEPNMLLDLLGDPATPAQTQAHRNSPDDIMDLLSGTTVAVPPASANNGGALGAGIDLLGMGMPQPAAPPLGGGLGRDLDLFGTGNVAAPPASNLAYVPSKETWLSATQGKGLEITGTFARVNGLMQLQMTLTNRAMVLMSDFAIQLDKNSFGVTPGPLSVGSLHPNQSLDASVVLNLGGTVQVCMPLTTLKVAVKNNIGVHIFSTEMPIHLFFVEAGRFDRSEFIGTWKALADKECERTFRGLTVTKETIAQTLETNNVFVIADRQNEQTFYYCSVKFTNNLIALIEISSGFDGNAKVAVKSRSGAVVELVCNAVGSILTDGLTPAPLGASLTASLF